LRFIWSDSFQTGHNLIDKQHKELFNRANIFFETTENIPDEEQYIETLNFLVSYVKEHFKTEEDLMKECNYPLLAGHKKEHEELVKKLVTTYKELIKGGFNESIIESTNALVQEWYVSHINMHDKKMAEFIKNN